MNDAEAEAFARQYADEIEYSKNAAQMAWDLAYIILNADVEDYDTDQFLDAAQVIATLYSGNFLPKLTKGVAR